MKVKGQLKNNFYLAFTINNFQDQINDEKQFLYKNRIQNNAENFLNNTYYYYFGINISDQCDMGQYYDNKR